MSAGKVLLLFTSFLLPCISAATLAQSQTTGRIAGTVEDEQGAVIVGAEVTTISRATGEERKVITDREGNFAVSLLPSGTYLVSIRASGFKSVLFDNITVAITETTKINAEMVVRAVIEESVTVNTSYSLIQTDGPQRGRIVDSRTVSELPLATRNFTQILALSPGTSAALPDNTAVGRNSQQVSVNGARVTHNNFQINGVDANYIHTNNAAFIAVPAPETIQEFKVQTSLYDATFGRSGGGNIQVVTKSGTNDFHGEAYEYFRHEALNANNPFLKSAGVKRPVLGRHVFGGILGGPIRKEKALFFVSYQGTRELNGASRSSLSSSVLIAPCKGASCLTDDRSEPTLRNAFKASSIHPAALALLNVKLANGQFLIPTPQADGRYSGSTPSRYREDQFNANVDFRLNEQNWLAAKFFFSNAPSTLALFGANVPGFGAEQKNNNRIISLQDVHIFSSRVINEARLGYNFIRQETSPQESVRDSEVGIKRSNANALPGLPLISIAPDAGGVNIGTDPQAGDTRTAVSSVTAANVLSIRRGKHNVRTGAEVRYYQNNFTRNLQGHGSISTQSFRDFLIGTTTSSSLGTGVGDRSLRTTDYNLFIQDDWKFSSKLTLNLGLRYELDLPPYDTRGRISTFDPALYKPRMQVDSSGNPVGPPIGGFVQAGNVISQYDLPEVPNVGKRVFRSVDPNNFAPCLGFAYSPRPAGRFVVRGGYGIFYSRGATLYLFNSMNAPPYYVVGRRSGATLADPFPALPSQDQFPTFVRGIALTTQVLDRNIRTPYFYQYNLSLQYAVGKDLLLDVAYVATRGLDLQRLVSLNQARLAGPDHAITNEVTRAVITTNTPANAQLRAPFQGVATNTFAQNQFTAQSTYNSLQMSLNKRLSHGLQFLASYTYAKSLDNASSGSVTGDVGDSTFVVGSQLDNRSNRGVSDFDRTHRFVLSYLWGLPRPGFAARSTAGRLLLSDWQVASIIIAMSGLPIDIVDSDAGSFYGLMGGKARPDYAPGATRRTATSNIPAGYFFNPLAFARPVVLAGQLIPSSNGTATAGATGTDFGNIGRNQVRGPGQTNVDFSVIRRFRISESKNIEFHVEFFNLFNHVNFANPISNLNAVQSSGGSIDPNTGQIINPGDFGRIISTSNNPRLIQLALKLNF
jgi:hypothetical protein